MEEQLFSFLINRKIDILIHAAAISDYTPKNVNKNVKINSKKQNISIDLKKMPKMVNSIKIKSKNKNIKLVAFKLTAENSEINKMKKVENLFQRSNADLIVQNDISDRIENVQSGYNLYNRKSKVISASKSKDFGEIILSELGRNF